MPKLDGPRFRTSYADTEDFRKIFAEDDSDLFRLSLQLTADAEKAKVCLILAETDCLLETNITTDQAKAWVRWMVIRNAIDMTWGTAGSGAVEASLEFHLQPCQYPIESLRESAAVLTLPLFDRLAFVICVLERYSILDCALLLRKTPNEVHEAIFHAIDEVLLAEELLRSNFTASSSDRVYRLTGGRSPLTACGSLVDRDWE